MKRPIALLVVLVIALVACTQNITDYRVHHIVTRIKADSVVDQRNAWCLWPNNPKPAVGSDVLNDACSWTNPTKDVHP